MKFDRLESLAAAPQDSAPGNGVSRRIFLKGGVAAGSGLMLGFGLPAFLGDVMAEGSSSFAPNAFIRVGADDVVTVLSKHIEFGQGPFTGLATLVAEEMDADHSADAEIAA